MSRNHEGKNQSLDINGINLAVRTWGDESGSPVLALHGWLDNAASFERIAPHLRNCFVVAPDLAGHGWSDHRRSDTGYYLWDHANDMASLVQCLGWHRYSIIAHSMGTGVASILSAMDKGIRSIVFLDGMGAPFTVVQDETADHLRRAHRLMKMAMKSGLHGFSDKQTATFPSIQAAIEERKNGVGGPISAESASILVERDLIDAGSGYRWRHDPRLTLPELLQLTEQQAGEFIRKIDSPLHIVLGRAGLFTGENLERKKRYLPPGTPVHWHDGGHHFHLDCPSDDLIALIDDVISTSDRSKTNLAACS